ncbi:hypothetical protein F751_2169 [Auxenochlorella protothecoides]|uniref:EF-hand domain-containing protein n=1 Tax=Auxenochlorella protothecoides TaxID=3075 RepID=A0A087SLH8_AUXPR|nr:hypothetical protein F751_2169 [Auxenochlorella protothecoides]KFM26582.1 hypothetical protein F751_2169 [Auxenochlorella protothecoides]
MDRDGRIDYEEWLLFLALLSIPTEDIQVAFHMVDANHSGSIEVLELEALLVSLRKRRNAEALMESITGARGGSLTLARFAQFVNSLRDEVMAMEFAFYDVDSKGVMAAQDFAYSVIGATRLKHLDQYLDKIKVLEYLFDDGDGGLNIHFLREVMNQSYITGLRIEADDAGRQEKPGVLTCMVMCLKR